MSTLLVPFCRSCRPPVFTAKRRTSDSERCTKCGNRSGHVVSYWQEPTQDVFIVFKIGSESMFTSVTMYGGHEATVCTLKYCGDELGRAVIVHPKRWTDDRISASAVRRIVSLARRRGHRENFDGSTVSVVRSRVSHTEPGTERHLEVEVSL